MHITKQELTHMYRKQAGGYQWGEGRGQEQERRKGLRGTNYSV